MSERLSILAARLRDFPAFDDLPATGTTTGFYRRAADDFYSVQVRLGSVTYTLGETIHARTAALFSDCCQHWFAPWLRRNRDKLAAYNFGPSAAENALRKYPEFRELLVDLEIELVGSHCIAARAVKQAGRDADLDLKTLQNLSERVAELERRMSEYDIKRGRPGPVEPAPITTFAPPGKMKHEAKNFVHHESINPAIAKSIFKI